MKIISSISNRERVTVGLYPTLWVKIFLKQDYRTPANRDLFVSVQLKLLIFTTNKFIRVFRYIKYDFKIKILVEYTSKSSPYE